MIMNYQLLYDGWLPISVAKEDRFRYYEALEAYAIDGDIKPFALFILKLEEKELDQYIVIIHQMLNCN